MAGGYRTVYIGGQGEIVEKKSRFIATVRPVKTEQEAVAFVEEMRKKYWDARHNCHAFTIGKNRECTRCSDDGEPSGTAGRPIHGQLLSKDLTNTLVVVVRYFGGIKLGVSGLITAYKAATKDALDNAVVIEKTSNDVYRIEFEYVLMNDVMRLLKDEGLEQFNQRFELNCSIDFSVRKARSERVAEAFKKIRGTTLTYLRTE
jgi:uncharacterized YigZ family protein